MLRKVLVANRGEIACRVIRACRGLGIATVAVYSEADADAPHVSMADESVLIGPPRSQQSYLNTKKILEAAHACGADSIHPGYGFLSENDTFAEAVMKAGLVWIGPDPESIRKMGDKQSARLLAIQAGVPVAPGSRRLDETDVEDIETEAAKIGYPLLIKASAGGGGIGMRQVFEPNQLKAAFETTQSQARAAFGCGDVFLEKLVARARHVEVQIFGFGSTAVHVRERDCSTQRRFQKVIEEAPAPNISDPVRRHLQEAAVALSTAVGYQGAGTVEFILDVDTEAFYFLEMNTRIQVEHPVTEMISGLDLVAMQLQHAGGELKSIRQEDIVARGHALECRVYAENPAKHFMPSPGKLLELTLPAQDAGTVRVETGYTEGSEISIYYDPMIAKIITHGTDRGEAIDRMIVALGHTRISGVRTNIEFLTRCLNHPDFRAGRITTSFIADHQKDLCG
ncbi:acetyl-CoA carboxylase biotin carboxylase subunit [Castellaniella sp.]|uniref:acetyl-CoA carboxylase biotin carboxylase subunit n=1 Tax=Castellaniella sp. TaxID=1955812 RepID=UPI003A8F85A4